MPPLPFKRAMPLAELVEGCMSEALARQGFATADIVASWADIAGEPLATWSRPVKLEWPRRASPQPDAPVPPATLVLRVEGAFALEAQHRAPVLIERINALYGWQCVGKIVLKQGPVSRPAPPPPPRRALAPEEAAAIAAQVAGIEEEPLRAALTRLGAAMRTRPKSGPLEKG